MKADREVVALLGSIWVHDLANLVAVAETSALLVERAEGDAEKVAKHAARIRRTLAAAKALATRCLAVGRGEPIERREVSLHSLARTAWEHARGEREVAFVVDASEDACVFVEEPLFLSVLANLLRNAIEASATTVRLSIDGATVTIRDDGEGVDEARVPRGNGIGLDGSRTIMRLHEGALAIERAERGTLVTLSGEDLVRRAAG